MTADRHMQEAKGLLKSACFWTPEHALQVQGAIATALDAAEKRGREACAQLADRRKADAEADAARFAEEGSPVAATAARVMAIAAGEIAAAIRARKDEP